MKKLVMIVVMGWMFSGCYEMPTDNINDNYYSTNVSLVVDKDMRGTISYPKWNGSEEIGKYVVLHDTVYKVPTGGRVEIRMYKNTNFYHKSIFIASERDTVVNCTVANWTTD
jgi:hypothetical protein